MSAQTILISEHKVFSQRFHCPDVFLPLGIFLCGVLVISHETAASFSKLKGNKLLPAMLERFCKTTFL